MWAMRTRAYAHSRVGALVDFSQCMAGSAHHLLTQHGEWV